MKPATMDRQAATFPGLIIGAGLPGLFSAAAGFIAWRRSHRAMAAQGC